GGAAVRGWRQPSRAGPLAIRVTFHDLLAPSPVHCFEQRLEARWTPRKCHFRAFSKNRLRFRSCCFAGAQRLTGIAAFLARKLVDRGRSLSWCCVKPANLTVERPITSVDSALGHAAPASLSWPHRW